MTALLLNMPCVGLAAETIRINGSGSALDMMKPIIAAFQNTNKNITIVMEKPLGSSGALKALLAGALDVVLSSKQLKPEDVARGARLEVYGKTPLVLIAEKNVRITNITSRELENIYTGKTTKWPNGEVIRLVLRPQEDIDSKIIASLSPGMAQAMTTVRSRPGMIVAVTDPEAFSAVSKTPGGLGATGMTSIIVEKIPVTSFSLNGVTANPRTLADGTYQLSKEISIVTTAKTPAAANRLIHFMHSAQGRAIAARNGVLVTSGAAALK